MHVHSLYWGQIDWIMMGGWILLNVPLFILFRKKPYKLLGCFYQFVIALLFGIVFPFISQFVEISKVVAVNGVDDAFTVMYTIMRYPIYWLLGIIQLFAIYFRKLPKE